MIVCLLVPPPLSRVGIPPTQWRLDLPRPVGIGLAVVWRDSPLFQILGASGSLLSKLQSSGLFAFPVASISRVSSHILEIIVPVLGPYIYSGVCYLPLVVSSLGIYRQVCLVFSKSASVCGRIPSPVLITTLQTSQAFSLGLVLSPSNLLQ